MYNDDGYIANETARGQLEHKTKFRHLWTHTMEGKKNTDDLASTLLLYQLPKIMQTHQNKTALKQCGGNL